MRKLLFGVCLLVLPLACDSLQKAGNQLSARTVMVGTLLSTPPVQLQPAAFLAGDAGFPLDAGFAAADAGRVTVPGQTVAFVFLGSKVGETFDTPPAPINSAQVSVNPLGGASVALTFDGEGKYSKTSIGDGGLTYESGKSYEFRAVSAGQTYVGEVENAPVLEQIAQFHPPKGFVEQVALAPLTFARAAPPAGEERTLGFVYVFPIDDNGQKGDPTYTNVPKTPVQFLKLIAVPGDWKTAQVTIPGTAFPSPKQTYVVAFQSVKSGGAKSENLFTGSALLAGTSDIGVVRTQ